MSSAIKRVHATEKLKECATERYRKEILAVFDVSTFDDQVEIHPKHLCRKCLRKDQHQSSGKRNYDSQHFTAIQWTEHQRNNCRILHKAKGSIVIPNSELLSTIHGHDCNIFTCAICQCILGCGTSVQTSCEHNFCSECLGKYFIKNKCKVSHHVQFVAGTFP
ncbi:uncharacterized protein LOC135153081 [Lytechinus pictus]|uniref:uncharacterized protein LOC135153081 n=1 Tax=Lytechinus pictus TaxID=7653 RepID=UPI0030B9D1FB